MFYKWGNDRFVNMLDRDYLVVFWVGILVKGIYVFLFNIYDMVVNMWVVFVEILFLKFGGKGYLVYDMWIGEDFGIFRKYFELEVKVYDIVVLIIIKVDGKVLLNGFRCFSLLILSFREIF